MLQAMAATVCLLRILCSIFGSSVITSAALPITALGPSLGEATNLPVDMLFGSPLGKKDWQVQFVYIVILCTHVCGGCCRVSIRLQQSQLYSSACVCVWWEQGG